MPRPWDSEEERKLLDMGDDPSYAKRGGSNADWALIATNLNIDYFNNRTASACENRWRSLNKRKK